MSIDTTGPVIGGAVGVLVVFCLSSPSLLAFRQRIEPGKQAVYEPLDGLYEDDDGKASDETQKRFSTLIPRSTALVAAVLGFFSSLSCSILINTDVAKGPLVESWLRTASWVTVLPFVSHNQYSKLDRFY